MQPHTEAIFDHVSLHEGDRVLDVACGTGIVTRVAVTRFPTLARIVGVDLNPNMLDIARAHSPATSVPVAWQEGDMCALPFPDASFDVVDCQHGLQYVPDKLVALRDIHRVLVPGGRLIFTVWSRPHRDNAALADAPRGDFPHRRAADQARSAEALGEPRAEELGVLGRAGEGEQQPGVGAHQPGEDLRDRLFGVRRGAAGDVDPTHEDPAGLV